MRRSFTFACAVLALVGASWTTALALGSDSTEPIALPARALANESLSTFGKVALSRTIGPRNRATYRIARSALDDVRPIASTSRGTLYLVL
jgi:hypothetical protein